MRIRIALAAAGICVFAMVSSASAQVDAGAAEALAKAEKCTKCHDVERAKKASSFKAVAAKYKGKADGEATITKMLTTGGKVKAADGTEDEHDAIGSKDAKAVKNLVGWILSR